MLRPSNQYFRHDPAADWTKTMTSCTSVGFAENVVPERSLAMPTRESEATYCGCLLRYARADLSGL